MNCNPFVVIGFVVVVEFVVIGFVVVVLVVHRLFHHSPSFVDRNLIVEFVWIPFAAG